MNNRWSKKEFEGWQKRSSQGQMPIPFNGEQPKKVRKKKSNEEYNLQVSCVGFFEQYFKPYSPVFFHCVNQAVINSARIGGMLKKLGRKRGVWDMKLQVPKGSYWGIWFEFKIEGGGLSEEQERFRELSIQLGCKYKWVEIRSKQDFLREISDYLEDERFKIHR